MIAIPDTLTNDFCAIDADSYASVLNTQGEFFERIARIDREKVASDLLNPAKAENQALLLCRFCDLRGTKVLEIGSGLGINHIVWTKKYAIDGYGVEPSAEGFESSHAISKQLIELNGLDARRIIDAEGEQLPFENESFDVVYSTNVLEHTHDPVAVLREAIRVLRVGGIMQIVYPNYHSYFDGHYAVFHPPIFSRRFFPWYVRVCHGRDPAFARTLRTELNVAWTKRVLQQLRNEYNFKLLSIGEETFLERMESAQFDAWAGLTEVARLLRWLRLLGINRVAARLLIACHGLAPIILTLKKTSA